MSVEVWSLSRIELDDGEGEFISSSGDVSPFEVRNELTIFL